METTIVIILVVLLFAGFFIFKILIPKQTSTTKPAMQKSVYAYTKRPQIMTNHELGFYKMLAEVAGDRYYLFPQVHLSALLDHKVKGQNWDPAFKHINGKSVDYVLCDKTTLSPVYAIELDDTSHDSSIRQTRDTEVERMFQVAGLPLIRFRDYRNLTLEDIAQRFYEAHQTIS